MSSNKRKSDAIETAPVILRTCSNCRPFCASWAADYSCAGGFRYIEASHCHCSDSSDCDADKYSEQQAVPTRIGPGSDGCTVGQRLAFLGCLYKLSSAQNKSEDFSPLLSDPQFLQRCFRELLYDPDPKTLRLAVLYGCNKVQPECHALAHHQGVKELETQVGSLEVYRDDDRENDEEEDDDAASDEESSVGGDCPYEVAEIDQYADEAHHFCLSPKQWKQLRDDEGCTCCRFMSVFTFRNNDHVDVKAILDLVQVL